MNPWHKRKNKWRLSPKLSGNSNSLVSSLWSSVSGLRSSVSSSRGFTLIEILLVVIIIGILVSLVAPRLAGRSEEARKQAAKADIDGGISLALDLYEVDNGRYPAKLDDLIHKASDAPNWRGPYLKKGLPKDPWGTPYVYRMPGTHNTASYDLYSNGPDKQEGSQDDIVNWETQSAY